MAKKKQITKAEFIDICHASVKLISPQNRPPVNEIDIWWDIRKSLVNFLKAVPEFDLPDSNVIDNCTARIRSLIDEYGTNVSGDKALQIVNRMIVKALTGTNNIH